MSPSRRGSTAPKPTNGGARDLPLWVPPLVYAVATLILFRKFVVSDAMLFGSDTLGLGYVARAGRDIPMWRLVPAPAEG